MSDTPVRFGLVGYGLFGSHHANAISNCVNAELAAIAVRSDASQRLARDAHPAADVLGDYRALIARDDIEVVSVVAPNTLHYEIAKAVLEGSVPDLQEGIAVMLACGLVYEKTRESSMKPFFTPSPERNRIVAYQDSSRVRDKLAEIEVAIQETNDQLQATLKKLPALPPNHSPSTNGNSNV